MHKIFYIDSNTVRNKFLSVAIEEHLGDLSQRNKSNYLPTQVEHVQPINDLPDDVIIHEPVAQLEAFEADYMIITKQRNASIIAQQLSQMNILKFAQQYYVKEKKPLIPG